ncbi:PR domain zinc finger protein 5 [Trichonephila clavipes]|nr:PR domain zinc finger protein 5 [Trichonephila clavipes]
MIVQFRNEKVSNHGSIPITIDCNVVAFIVIEEGFHQSIKRTKHFTPNAAVLFVDVAIQPEVRFIAKQNSLMKIGNNGNLVLGPFDESTPCLMIVLMNCLTKLRINHLTAVKSVTILESNSAPEPPSGRRLKVMRYCTFCNFTTSHKGHMERHMRIHTNDCPFVCVVAAIRDISLSCLDPNDFTVLNVLSKVMCAFHPLPCGFVCARVSLYLLLRPILILKILVLTPLTVSKRCSVCEFLVIGLTIVQFLPHSSQHDTKNIIDSACYPFIQWRNVHPSIVGGPKPDRHLVDCGTIQKTHKQNTQFEEANYHCSLCPFSSLTNYILDKHMQTHFKKYTVVCEVCYKRFQSNRDLEVHLRSHSGERPFVCTVCSKGFSHKGNFKAHLMTHGSSYQCKICNKKFTSQRSLILHALSHPL